MHYLETYELLTECRFGFRLKHSTVGALQSLLSDFYEGIEAQNAVIFRPYDMSKAFNTVAHKF